MKIKKNAIKHTKWIWYKWMMKKKVEEVKARAELEKFQVILGVFHIFSLK